MFLPSNIAIFLASFESAAAIAAAPLLTDSADPPPASRSIKLVSSVPAAAEGSLSRFSAASSESLAFKREMTSSAVFKGVYPVL